MKSRFDRNKLRFDREDLVYADDKGGGVLGEDEMWYPFRYQENGEREIWNQEGFLKASAAYAMYKLIYN